MMHLVIQRTMLGDGGQRHLLGHRLPSAQRQMSLDGHPPSWVMQSLLSCDWIFGLFYEGGVQLKKQERSRQEWRKNPERL
jgi:hypothetical protein